MKLVRIGAYSLGSESVELFLRDGVGGNFSTRSDSEQQAAIYIGGDEPEWYMVVSAFLHEALEFAAMRMGLRFEPDIDIGRNASGYVFFATHTQFAEQVGRAAQFSAVALPALATAWKKWNQPLRKKGART